MLENKSVVLLKLNAGSYGTDAAPSVTDALLVGPVKIEPQFKTLPRKVVLPWAGSLADIKVGETVKLGFPIEIFGSGFPTTPPKHGPILKAAGFLQTIGYASEVSDSGNKLSGYGNITGIATANVEAATGKLYIEVTGASPYTLNIYKDAAKLSLVGHCADYTTTGAKAVVADTGSGLGGTITVDSLGTTEAVISCDVSYAEDPSMDVADLTIYVYEDGILYKVLGCVADSLKADLTPNNTGSFDCSFVGLWGGNAAFASDVAMVAPDFGSLQTPPLFNSAAFAAHAFTGLISKFGFNVANKLIQRPDPNATNGISRLSLHPNERKITGGFDPEMPALATNNPWDKMEDSALGSVTASVGSTVGNRMVITAPNTQLETKIGARDGVRTYDLSWEAKLTLASGAGRVTFRFN